MSQRIDPDPRLRRPALCLLAAGLLLGAACTADEPDPGDPDAPGGIVSPTELAPGWKLAPRAVSDGAASLVEPIKFSAVLRQGGNYRTVLDVEWPSFVASWQQLSGQGFRLIDIDTTLRGATRYYTGVFEPGGGGYALWVGSDWDGFIAKWRELSAQNLRLVDVETYLEGSQRVYTGVWREGTDNHGVWFGLDWTSFVNKWSELGAQGQRLIDLEVWEEYGQLRYGGVWRAGSDGYGLWVGADWNSFARKWMELGASGLRLVDLEPYTYQGSRLYAGVFRAGGDAYDLVGATSSGALPYQLATLAAEGKQPISIQYEAGGDMPPPGLAAALHDAVDGHAVGYSFAVAENGRVISQGGFGYARAPWEASSPSVPMTGTRRSHLASVSKTITAISLLNLLEDSSRYTIDTRLMDIVGNRFPVIGAGVGNVTLRNLLQHRSGMEGWGYCGPDGVHADYLASMRDLVSRPLATSIGTYSYSNGNFCLLRMAVEALAGTDYATYVRTSVLAPLGITDMTCAPDAVAPTLYYARDQTAPGYFWSDDYSSHCGAYGWYASADDLARLLGGLRTGGVLSPFTLTAMQVLELGWYAAGTSAGTAYHHNGAWYTGDGRGYNGAIARLPAGLDASLLIDTHGFDTVGILLDGFNRMQSY
jgi:CubicO group peptidase (beta-lactamase class C family)